MAYLQERMTHYLTSDPRLFVAEEREFQYGDDPIRDLWIIDAFAVNPWAKTFWLGEATYNPKPAPLMKKIRRFYEIEDEVAKKLNLNGLSDGWNVRPWLFIRKDAVPYILSKLPSGCFPRITYLEETAFPWIYKPYRLKGEEPNKPYSSLDENFQ